MKKYTLWFKLLIILDYLLNVVTGGGFDTCFSTRSYINTMRHDNIPKWVKIAALVDWIMREKDHCLKSYAWEMKHKQKWIDINTL